VNLYPAIDLRGGNVVQLQQGDYSRETVYGTKPVDVAKSFEDAGVRWIHVVDLDAARDGGAPNLRAIEAICASTSVNVQTGGGIRSVADASDRFAAGVTRVVLGTAAVEQPEVADELADLHPGQVAVGLDARGRDVAIRGWAEVTGADLLELVARFDRPGVGALVVTDISRDGMLGGPAFEQLEVVLGAASVPVIASGGIAGIADLERLAALDLDGKRLEGAITGTAIYERRFTVEEGIAACSPSA
jgi:phosphoribosylformimino-5-aminoimidazole carboxamide ribotide isomerase